MRRFTDITDIFRLRITEKDGNDGNLLLYYMIVEGGVGVFAYNTLNFIVLRYICGCLGRWHFGMSDMVRLFGVPFGIQFFFFTLMSLFDFLKSIIY